MAFETMNSGSPNGLLEERMRVHMNGNVGIGTNDPKEKLEINGSIRGNRSGALRISTDHGYMDVGPQNRDWSHFYTDRSKYYFNKEIRVSSGKIGSYAEDLSLCTSGTERIRVKRSNGNVGIGTSAPGAKLSINGGLHVGGDSDPGNDNLLVDGDIAISGKHAFRGRDSWLRLNQDKAFRSGVHTPGVFAPMSLNVGGAGSWGDPGPGNVWITGNVGIRTVNPNIHLAIGDSDTGLKQQGDGELAIYTNNKERVRIDKSGNVGIGTTNPGEIYKLDVRGYNMLTDPESKYNSHFPYRDNCAYITGSKVYIRGGKPDKWKKCLTVNSASGWTRIGDGISPNNIQFEPQSGFHRVAFNELRFWDWDTRGDMVTFKDGNVGIGTLQPSDKLHVAGSFIRVDGAGQEQAYIGGDGWGSDVQIGSHNAKIMNVGMWNTANGKDMKVYALDFIKTSDLRYKMNIQTISNALDKTLKLRGVMYNDRNQVESQDLDSGSEHKIGLIGQEVEEIVPQVVFRDKKGFCSISYTSIIPLLIEAMKEQQKMIEELKDTIISDIKGDSRT